MFNPTQERSMLDHAYNLGFEAFEARRHYSENPFNEGDWQRADRWDEGWADAEAENPGAFDYGRDNFVYTLPHIKGNPSCPF
jgi:hypothetical protein